MRAMVLVLGVVSALVVAGCVGASGSQFEPPPDGGQGGGNPCDGLGGGDLVQDFDGTCWWERCVDGEPAIIAKPAGWPCVYRAPGATVWTETQCYAGGVCGAHCDGGTSDASGLPTGKACH